jgi:hypothetical protein
MFDPYAKYHALDIGAPYFNAARTRKQWRRHENRLCSAHILVAQDSS